MSNPYDCFHCHNEGYDHAPDCPYHPDNLRYAARREAEEATASTRQPVTVEALRADWDDNPYMSTTVKNKLQSLPDAKLEEALERAFKPREDEWFSILDSTRNDATDRLLDELDSEREF